MIIVVRSRRRDTSHLVSYINLRDHISSPLIAFKSTRIPINFTGAFFNNISARARTRTRVVYLWGIVRSRRRGPRARFRISIRMLARTYMHAPGTSLRVLIYRKGWWNYLGRHPRLIRSEPFAWRTSEIPRPSLNISSSHTAPSKSISLHTPSHQSIRPSYLLFYASEGRRHVYILWFK